MDFIGKTVGPVLFETACISDLQLTYLLTYLLDRSRESAIRQQTMRSFMSVASSPVLVAPVSIFS